MSELDNATETVASSETVAPLSVGDQPGSTPAPVETTAPDAAAPDEAEKARQAQTRKDAARFASLRRQVLEKEREIGRLQGLSEATKPAQPAATSGPPKQSDFNSFDEWQAAVVKHAVTEAVQEAAKANRQQAGEQDAGRKTQETGEAFWKSAAKEAKDKGIVGFDAAEQAIKAKEVPTSNFMSHYVVSVADNKAALVVWLADNLDEAERIADLDPVAAGAAMAKVDAQLGRKASAAKSSAPAPVSQVAGGGTVASTVERMSHADLIKLTGKWNRGR